VMLSSGSRGRHCARISDLSHYPAHDPQVMRLQRLCAANAVTVEWQHEIERIDVPLVGSHRVAIRPGAEWWRLRIVQGPRERRGARPLPPTPVAGEERFLTSAHRTSFGGIEVVLTFGNYEQVVRAIQQLERCLERTGDLRSFRVPVTRTFKALLFLYFDPDAPFRGYDLAGA
jgi:hypothetical protein